MLRIFDSETGIAIDVALSEKTRRKPFLAGSNG